MTGCSTPFGTTRHAFPKRQCCVHRAMQRYWCVYGLTACHGVVLVELATVCAPAKYGSTCARHLDEAAQQLPAAPHAKQSPLCSQFHQSHSQMPMTRVIDHIHRLWSRCKRLVKAFHKTVVHLATSLFGLIVRPLFQTKAMFRGSAACRARLLGTCCRSRMVSSDYD